ncbi:MAG: hypothetical protein M4579_004276 [Chaenotheca gracillima]|nr:MAG: hypothetical protein M4579_004276 [Chaenotheca gracillima]
MTTPYVCLSCRFQVSRKFGQANPHRWSQKIRFASTQGAIPTTEETAKQGSEGRAPSQGRRRRAERIKPGQDRSLEKLFGSSTELQGRHQSTREALERRPFRHRSTNTEATISLPTPKSSTTQVSVAELGWPIGHNSDADLVKCWRQFDELLVDGRDNFFRRLSAHERVQLSKGQLFQSLLRRTVDACVKPGDNGAAILGPAMATAKLQRAGLMDNSYWTGTLQTLLVAVAQGKEENRHSDAARNLQEVVRVWNVLFRSLRLSSPLKSSSVDPLSWSCLPHQRALERIKIHSSKLFESRFLHFLPQLASSREGPEIATAALATYQLLRTQAVQRVDVTTSSNTPFLRFLAHLVPYSDTETSSLRSRLEEWGCPGEFVDGMLVEFENPTPNALVFLASLKPEHAPKKSATEDERINALFFKRLSRVLEKSDVRRAEALWDDAQNWYGEALQDSKPRPTTVITSDNTSKTCDTEQNPTTNMPAALYDRFMMVFMALRSPNKAIDVWNRLIREGSGPSQSTWNSMLSGCQTARDVRSSNDVWQKMQDAKIKPDVGCWTTRIHTLSSGRRYELGLQALNEMGHRWLDAVSRSRHMKSADSKAPPLATLGDVDGFVKPTIQPVNAAISGLARHGRAEDVGRVMAWAETLGIAPDVFTFNTLIRHAIRAGDATHALEILQKMEAHKVIPDIVTFTTLLDGFVRDPNVTGDTADQQQPHEIMMKMLEEMEDLGIKANAFSYGTLIDALLTQHSNLAAAETVLDHMISKGIRPSPHINTMLLRHYFEQPSPDLGRLESLWRRILHEGAIVDALLYDRMVEGYARIGKITMMMSFMRRMLREGKKPGWGAVVAVVRALVAQDQWESAAEVIDDATRRDGPLRAVARDRRSQDEFEELVVELRRRGLRLPSEQQEGKPTIPS